MERVCECGDDEDLHGAGHGLDVGVGARGARYEVAATRLEEPATRLEEPAAANDREAGNENTRQEYRIVDSSSL